MINSKDKIIQFKPYSYSKKFYIWFTSSPELEEKCGEYVAIVLAALNDLRLNFTKFDENCYILRFERQTDVEGLTESIKGALRYKFKGGRMKKMSIRNICVSFPNNMFFMIDLINA